MGVMYISLIFASLIGALFGFLIFNFYPAKIFMGDTGSLFLGSLFAMTSIILAYFLIDNWIKIFIFIILFSYPLLDVLLAIIRRLKTRRIFSPDNRHIHHIIKYKTKNHQLTVLVIYLLNIVYAILSFLFYRYNLSIILIIYAIYSLILLFYFGRLMFKTNWD